MDDGSFGTRTLDCGLNPILEAARTIKSGCCNSSGKEISAIKAAILGGARVAARDAAS